MSKQQPVVVFTEAPSVDVDSSLFHECQLTSCGCCCKPFLVFPVRCNEDEDEPLNPLMSTDVKLFSELQRGNLPPETTIAFPCC